jgi:hypothetical protein
MKSVLNYFIAAIFALQTAALPAFAEDNVHVCNRCIGDEAKAGDVVERGGERWVLDHAEHARGHTVWFATHEGPRGRSMGEGAGPAHDPAVGNSLGNGSRSGPGSERITGHDFSDFEDNIKASKREREELAMYRAKAIARVNEETIVDAAATSNEVNSELDSLSNAVQSSSHIDLYEFDVAAQIENSIDAVASAVNAEGSGNGISAAEAGWQIEDDHQFVSDHKESLEKVRSRLNRAVPKNPQQADAKAAGFGVLVKSDQAYLGFDTELGDKLLGIAVILADIATDVIPVSSIPKDFYRAVVGRDPVHGHELKNWERYLAAGFVVLTIGTAGTAGLVTPELRALAKAASLTQEDLALAEKISKGPVSEYGAKLIDKTKSWLKDLQLGDGAAHNKYLEVKYDYLEPVWDAEKPLIWGKTARSQTFVRFTGPRSRPVGYWVIDAAQIKGMSPEEIKRFMALPATPTHFIPVTVPAGVEMGAGYFGKNKFGGGTGGIQFFLPAPLDNFFGTSTEIGRIFKGEL